MSEEKKEHEEAAEGKKEYKKVIMDKEKVEEIKVKGEQLIEKVKEIINEGNVRKIIIKDKNGHIVLQLPITFGVIGIVLAPMLAAVGAVAAMLTECSIVIERKE